MLRIRVLDANDSILAENAFEEKGYLYYEAAYQEGDKIQLETDQEGLFLKARLDDALPETLVYLSGMSWTYVIPSGLDREAAYPPMAFQGEKHYLSIARPSEEEAYAYRNVALNPLDQNKREEAFPHASANVETRNEANFFARNAIDGILANRDHWRWPYQSWGINRQPDAALRIYFGKEVEVDRIGIAMRADFPHDSYWTQATLAFSDGTEEIFSLEKDENIRYFPIEKRKVEWVELKDLIKAEDESPFPALTQLEVYGRYLKD